MRKLALALLGAAAVSVATAANATITIGAQGASSGTASVSNVDSPLVNRLQFDTIGATGNVDSYFTFKESFPSYATFAATTTDGTINLEQLLTGGGTSLIKSVSGTGFALELKTGLLAANTFYRFRYTANLPNGGNVSGTASFRNAVPEPATWALMMLGFGGIGLAMRRRQKPAIAQIA